MVLIITNYKSKIHILYVEILGVIIYGLRVILFVLFANFR